MKDSSGEAVDWLLIPDINAVLSYANLITPAFGSKYVSGTGAATLKQIRLVVMPGKGRWCELVWPTGLYDRGYPRKGYDRYQARGYDLDALEVAGAHTNRSTTQGDIRSREVLVSTVALRLPQSDAP